MALKSWIAAALAVACMLFASAQLATAQQAKCAPQPIVLQYLTGKYGETAVEGHVKDNVLFQLFANAETGTWTITGMRDGIMCLLQAGRDYDAETLNGFRAKLIGAAL